MDGNLIGLIAFSGMSRSMISGRGTGAVCRLRIGRDRVGVVQRRMKCKR